MKAPRRRLWTLCRADVLLLPLAAVAAGGVVWGFMGAIDHWRNRSEHRREEQQRQFDRSLAAWAAKATHGEFRQALVALLNLPGREASPECRFRWNLTMGRIHHQAAVTAPAAERADLYETARQFYLRALLNDPNAPGEYEIKTALAEVSFASQQPEKALDVCNELLQARPQAQGAARLRQLKMECLRRLPDPVAAWQGLAEEAAVAPPGELRLRVILAQVEILCAAAAAPAAASAEALVTAVPELAVPGQAPVVGLRQAARRLLDAALGVLLPTDERRAWALNRLLEICAADRDVPGAYRYYHNLRSTLCLPDDRVVAQMLIARVELASGNPAGAREALAVCLEEFPNSPKATEAYLELAAIEAEQKDWVAAFRTLSLVARRFPTMPVLGRVLKAVQQLTEAPWPQPLPPGLTAAELWRQCEALLVNLQIPPGSAGEELRRELARLRVVLATRRHDHVAAEEGVVHLLKPGLPAAETEPLYQLDLVCAQALQRSPAVIGYRAARYLAACPTGPHAEPARQALFQAYSDMGLHRQAAAVCQEAFVHELLKTQTAHPVEPWADGTNGIINLGRACVRLAEHERANLLFRAGMHGDRLPGLAAAVFEDWAAAAAAVGQVQEAERRLRLGCERIADAQERERLELARVLRSLPGMATEYMTADVRERWWNRFRAAPHLRDRQSVYEETVLSALSQHDPEEFRRELLRFGSGRPAGPWSEYWLLKALHMKLARQPPEETRRWTTALAGELLPQAQQVAGLPRGLQGEIDTLARLERARGRVDRFSERGLRP